MKYLSILVVLLLPGCSTDNPQYAAAYAAASRSTQPADTAAFGLRFGMTPTEVDAHLAKLRTNGKLLVDIGGPQRAPGFVIPQYYEDKLVGVRITIPAPEEANSQEQQQLEAMLTRRYGTGYRHDRIEVEETTSWFKGRNEISLRWLNTLPTAEYSLKYRDLPLAVKYDAYIKKVSAENAL